MEEILILCIGDSKLIGDSLGPLIGSFLERNKSDIGNNVKVLGTLEKPIGYNDLIEISKHINYNKEYYLFLQYIAYKQWMELKQYANSKGIEIIGDMPAPLVINKFFRDMAFEEVQDVGTVAGRFAADEWQSVATGDP
mgnify:CR=1 FL=1